MPKQAGKRVFSAVWTVQARGREGVGRQRRYGRAVGGRWRAGLRRERSAGRVVPMASPQLVTGGEHGGAYSVCVLVIRGRAESPGPVCFLGGRCDGNEEKDNDGRMGMPWTIRSGIEGKIHGWKGRPRPSRRRRCRTAPAVTPRSIAICASGRSLNNLSSEGLQWCCLG